MGKIIKMGVPAEEILACRGNEHRGAVPRVSGVLRNKLLWEVVEKSGTVHTAVMK